MYYDELTDPGLHGGDYDLYDTVSQKEKRFK